MCYLAQPLTSNSIVGQSVIKVEIKDRYFNLQEVWQRLCNKAQEAEGELPDGGAGKPKVNDDFGDVAVITLAMTAEGFDLGRMVVVGVGVMLFLGIRSGLIVEVIVPSVVLLTLSIMNFADMSLERMSLATIIVAPGLLVDIVYPNNNDSILKS